MKKPPGRRWSRCGIGRVHRFPAEEYEILLADEVIFGPRVNVAEKEGSADCRALHPYRRAVTAAAGAEMGDMRSCLRGPPSAYAIFDGLGLDAGDFRTLQRMYHERAACCREPMAVEGLPTIHRFD